MRLNQGAKIKIIGRALWLAEAAEIHAVSHGLVLQIALAALIADRTIQRVVDQQEFHHPFPGLFDHGRVGFHNRWLPFGTRAQVAHLHRTRGRRLGRSADHFDQAHAAVARDGQPFVIAKPGHFDARLLTGLDQGHGPVYFDFLSVDDDLAQLAHTSVRPQ